MLKQMTDSPNMLQLDVLRTDEFPRPMQIIPADSRRQLLHVAGAVHLSAERSGAFSEKPVHFRADCNCQTTRHRIDNNNPAQNGHAYMRTFLQEK